MDEYAALSERAFARRAPLSLSLSLVRSFLLALSARLARFYSTNFFLFSLFVDAA